MRAAEMALDATCRRLTIYAASTRAQYVSMVRFQAGLARHRSRYDTSAGYGAINFLSLTAESTCVIRMSATRCPMRLDWSLERVHSAASTSGVWPCPAWRCAVRKRCRRTMRWASRTQATVNPRTCATSSCGRWRRPRCRNSEMSTSVIAAMSSEDERISCIRSAEIALRGLRSCAGRTHESPVASRRHCHASPWWMKPKRETPRSACSRAGSSGTAMAFLRATNISGLARSCDGENFVGASIAAAPARRLRAVRSRQFRHFRRRVRRRPRRHRIRMLFRRIEGRFVGRRRRRLDRRVAGQLRTRSLRDVRHEASGPSGRRCRVMRSRIRSAGDERYRRSGLHHRRSTGAGLLIVHALNSGQVSLPSWSASHLA